MILHTLSVDSHSFKRNGSLALTQKLGSGREIWKQPQSKDARNNGECTKDKKDVHPPWQSGGDVADGIPDQPTQFRTGHAVSNDSDDNSPSKHGCDTIGAVICFQSQWLFFRCVPHAHQEHETGVDDCFD